MNRKHISLLALLSMTACSEPEPIATLDPPAADAVLELSTENASAYWLSHPSIALIAAEHNMGADTIMNIVNGFNALYPVKGDIGFGDRDDMTVGIRPIYEGKGAPLNLTRQFFLDQARYYKTTRQEIAKIIVDVYRYGNRYTPNRHYR